MTTKKTVREHSGGDRDEPSHLALPSAPQAKAGGFFSYSAGVAYKVSTDSHVGGVEIDNYHTSLPMGKGLSSSAAMCVLVARAFSRLYEIKMTLRGEMEYAYQGELVTPSRCGRMDQGCAFGCRPILMSYDGDFCDVEELRLGDSAATAAAAAPGEGGEGEGAGEGDSGGGGGGGSLALHYVIVDLAGSKSTTEILAGLQARALVSRTAVFFSFTTCFAAVGDCTLRRRVASQTHARAHKRTRMHTPTSPTPLS